MIDSRRRLPHSVPDGVPVFVTWRLAGTVPRVPQYLGKQASAGKRFNSADRDLDRADGGPVWLGDKRVAQMMVEALHYGATVKGLYNLHAYVVVPNHMHVVWEPRISLSRVMQWLKGVTAKRAKSLLNLNVKAVLCLHAQNGHQSPFALFCLHAQNGHQSPFALLAG